MMITEKERISVIRRFFNKENKIKFFPAKEKNKRIILEKNLKEFNPNKKYSEDEVDRIISKFSDDICTIRRAFIDYGYMKRFLGVYELTEFSKNIVLKS